MLKLTSAGLKDRKAWEQAGIELPDFPIEKMAEETEKHPKWVHFGSGNIFRAFIANLQQDLLNAKKSGTGIIAVEAYDEEIIDKIYRPFDNLSLLVLMSPDMSLKKRVIASIAQSLVCNPDQSADFNRIRRIFREPSLQMVSFTITEKGYNLVSLSGDYTQAVKKDFENGPEHPVNIMAKVASLIYTRYKAGGYPLALVSMDNCSRNGEKLCRSVEKFAEKWLGNGLVDSGFLHYLNDPSSVSFPWTMIDKITPRPSESVQKALENDGLADMGILRTSKATYIAPFVNTEVPQYLVVEDQFPNGRMPLEYAGVLFTDRETVQKVETMKVSTCLNPLHTALAVFGCLLGYKKIADEMKDSQLKKLVKGIGYDEGLPVVVDPGIVKPKEFLDEVVERRLPNANIPDTPQRIATDTSEKMAVRYGETIKSYCSRPDLDAKNLTYIPLVIAGWCRYLLCLDDSGEKMEPSFDPKMDELKSCLSGIKLGDPSSAGGKLRSILSNKELFGVDLYEAGIGEKIERLFEKMIMGKGAVRKVLSESVR